MTHRICDNGIYRDMTAEEIAELEKMQSEAPESEPTAEEQIADLKSRIDSFQQAFEIIMGVSE